QSWPPAWVKRNAAAGDANGNDRKDESGGIVIARGIRAAASSSSSTKVATPGPQVRVVESRLLVGSVSQKALMLQEELRNDRARLLELQRCSARGSTARALLCGKSPRNRGRDCKQPGKYANRWGCCSSGSAVSDADNNGGNHPPRRDRHGPCSSCPTPRSGGGGGVATAAVQADCAERACTTPPPPESVMPSAVLGYRFSAGGDGDGGDDSYSPERAGSGRTAAAAGAAADRTDRLEGSVEGSLSTGSLSSGAWSKARMTTEASIKRIGAVVPRVQDVVLRPLLREGASPPSDGTAASRPRPRVS
ncbi:unnamed protein product, partial [Hapterophycus canaliculatus]